MARTGYLDLMNTHHFWAFDAGSLTMPVFNPLFGFSGITTPEITAETEDIKDGTFMFPRSVIKGGIATDITFARGAAPWDSDFYDWINNAIYGGDQNRIGSVVSDSSFIRRDIVIVHFTRIDPLYTISRSVGGTGTSFANPDNLADLGGLGPVEVLSKIPGRAWLLHSCLPTRYKAGTDFNAQAGAISIMELTCKVEYVEEFSLGLGSPLSIF
jgi:hypothetical protein